MGGFDFRASKLSPFSRLGNLSKPHTPHHHHQEAAGLGPPQPTRVVLSLFILAWPNASLSKTPKASPSTSPPLPFPSEPPSTHPQVKHGAKDGIPPHTPLQVLASFPPSLAPISQPRPWGRWLLSLRARPSPRRRTCSDLLSRFPSFCRRCWPRRGKQLWGSSELPGYGLSGGQLWPGGWNRAGSPSGDPSGKGKLAVALWLPALSTASCLLGRCLIQL